MTFVFFFHIRRDYNISQSCTKVFREYPFMRDRSPSFPFYSTLRKRKELIRLFFCYFGNRTHLNRERRFSSLAQLWVEELSEWSYVVGFFRDTFVQAYICPSLPLSKVDTATYKLSGAMVRCLIGAGNRGRNDLRFGFDKIHFTNTHSPPPVYMWLPVYLKIFIIVSTIHKKRQIMTL